MPRAMTTTNQVISVSATLITMATEQTEIAHVRNIIFRTHENCIIEVQYVNKVG